MYNSQGLFRCHSTCHHKDSESILSTSIIPSLNQLLAPGIKKSIRDDKIIKNFRPISDSAFASKLIENVVDSQFESYITDNKRYGPLHTD